MGLGVHLHDGNGAGEEQVGLGHAEEAGEERGVVGIESGAVGARLKDLPRATRVRC
jgi:hypothetical protein